MNATPNTSWPNGISSRGAVVLHSSAEALMRSLLLVLSFAAVGVTVSAPQAVEAAAACTHHGLPVGCVPSPASGAAGRGANVNGGANRAGAR